MNRAPALVTLGLGQIFSLSAAAAPVFQRLYGDEQKETIVLIHGFISSHATWESVIPQLSKKFRVLVYDQPGHGASPAQGKDYSPQAMAHILANLLDEVGVAKVHVVGHSMGGRTAVKFAALFPERVLSLMVEDMGVEMIPSMEQALPAALSRYEKVRASVPRTFASEDAAARALSAYYTPLEILWLLAAASYQPDGSFDLGSRPEVTHLYLTQGLAEDLSKDLKSIKAPVAFFAGDAARSDTVLKDFALTHVQNVRPDALVRVFPGSGHKVHGDPDYVPALQKFISENAQPTLSKEYRCDQRLGKKALK